jgi:ABC-2 type transport system ATP-binding protein
MIDLSGVTKFYGDFKAVDNLSFSIKEGEVTGFLGPNGAGKTTTLRMISSYFEPDEGTVTVGGFNTKDSPLNIKRIIGYLPESAPLYGDMIVYDYLKYVAGVRGIEGDDKIRNAAETCRIKEVMHKNIMELSKGYRQRVGLAQAIIHDPDVLILDEPTSGLDPIEIIEIRNLIKELGKKKTVILSTHILHEVEATCDRVIIINKGKIAADDTTVNLQASVKGRKNISLKIKGASFDEASSIIRSISGVSSVEKSEDESLTSLVVTVSGVDDVRPLIFDAAVKNSWVLYEIKQDHLSLENIFRELTAGGSNE